MSHTFYNRYVPPKKAEAQHTQAGPPKPSTAPLKQNGASKSTDEKSGNKTESVQASRTVDVELSESRGQANIDVQSPSVVLPKRIKPKKRKAEDIEEAGDEESERHKSIFAKYQKSSRKAEAARQKQTNEEVEHVEEQDRSLEELHDLVPLPQPSPVPENQELPTFRTLPDWLAQPEVVQASSTVPFEELNIDSNTILSLQEHGFSKAFAIQCAVLPLLLPGDQHYFGDICISAATGSGKTLAYTLPMIESMRANAAATRLRGIIVVPTRELVAQVRDVAEICAAGTGLKIGVAVGSRALAAERDALINIGQRWDPETAKELLERAENQTIRAIDEDDALLDDATAPGMLPNHVPQYESKVDVLICTPGRLVEHIKTTQGFILDDLKWLVIDEADRLLDQSFQDWVDTVIGALEAEKPLEKRSQRERILSQFWEPLEKRYVRKIICSATMTKDLQQLTSLKLRRPKLVDLIGMDTEPNQEGSTELTQEVEQFEVPTSLKEWAIHVDEPADKPLFLLRLLSDKLETIQPKDLVMQNGSTESPTQAEGNSSDNESDETSSSDGSTTTSTNSSIAERRKKPRTRYAAVLVFTNSTENAARLSHLLTRLAPTYSIHTLTKSSSSPKGRRVLASFYAVSSSTSLRVLIASDRAARGLDIVELNHVINYDMPRSAKDYVHRVGRTARARRRGDAWTLVEEKEAWWFWNKVARGPTLRRAAQVDKVRLTSGSEDIASEGIRQQYVKALARLKEDVEAGKRGAKKEHK